MKVNYLKECLLLILTSIFFDVNATIISKLPFSSESQVDIHNVKVKNNVLNPVKKIGTKSHKSKSYIKPSIINSTPSSLLGKTFDYQYIGNINGALYLLKEYDSKLQVLPPLGRQTPMDVNIDVMHITINDLIDIITQQTKGNIKVIFNPLENTIRLVFDTTMNTGISALQESKKWQEGKTPRPVLSQDGMVVFPYGIYQPMLICQPLQICDIVLQPQEKIISKYIGDSADWILVTSSSGDNQGNEVQHVILKPVDSGLDTTLLINTNKRTYMIKLRSSMQGYVSRMGFYYPDVIQDSNNEADSKLFNNKSSQTNTEYYSNTTEVDSFDFNYKWGGDDVPWKPLRVFNDGHHVYIQLPDNVTSKDAPILLVYNGDVKEQVDFGINNHMLIVDMIFDKAVLLSGLDSNAKTITIEHTKSKKCCWF